jgi:hypothetical protein
MKCFIFECKSRGYFCDPMDQSEHFCATHCRSGMVSLSSLRARQSRHVILLNSTQGLRTRDVPKPKGRASKQSTIASTRTIPKGRMAVKPAQVSPPRVARVLTVPGAPKKVRIARAYIQVPVPVMVLEAVDDSEDELIPSMEIYYEIQANRFRQANWMQLARSIPLTMYLKN